MDIQQSIILADQTLSSPYDSGAYGGGSYSIGQSATGTTSSGGEQQTTSVQLAPQTTYTASQHASSLLWAWLFMFVAATALALFAWRLIVSRRNKRTGGIYETIVPPTSPAPQPDNYTSPRDPDFLL